MPNIERLFNGYELKEDEIKKLQHVLLNVLCDVKACCIKHGLSYILAYGTLLGAVRHQGFIPWDEDVDIAMPREDYEKIAKAMYEDYGGKYEVTDARDGKSPFRMQKVLLQGTKYIELLRDNYSVDECIFIDIFPIDNMPSGRIGGRARRFNFARAAFSLMLDSKYPSTGILEIAEKNKEVRTYYKKRLRIGKVLRVFYGFGRAVRTMNAMAVYQKYTGKMGVPMGSVYQKEIFDAEMYLCPSEVKFCGESFSAPQNCDLYLTRMYGDYMQIPNQEDRGHHYVERIDYGLYGDNS